jgi:hypothetical protein
MCGYFDIVVTRLLTRSILFYQAGAADINLFVSRGDAIATAERALDGIYNKHPATLEFFVQPDGFAALTHVIQTQNETAGAWHEAFVLDSRNNTLLSVTDFVRGASVGSVKQLDCRF